MQAMQPGVPPRAMGPGPRRVPAYSTFYFNFPLYVALLGLITAVLLKSAVHQIPEGHVGVYWRGGKLLERVTDPGIHIRMPLIDLYEVMQVTMQTDEVKDIPCGTKGGVNITFEKIEVVNRLRKEFVYNTIKEFGVHYDKTWIYDKIHHEINQFCSSHTLQEVYIDKFDQVDERLREELQAGCDKYATGIEIISVRITKPRIPPSIMDNYVAMEVERTRALVAAERQRVAMLEAETERKRALAEAEKEAQRSEILMKQRIAEMEARSKQQEIETQIHVSNQKGLADAAAYKARMEAEANRMRLTPEFLQLMYIQAVLNSSKVYFGDNIPKMVAESSHLEMVKLMSAMAQAQEGGRQQGQD